jgi:hypothetical protein
MKRKTLTPTGQPRQGELIILKDWRKRREPKKRARKRRSPDWPADSKAGDKFDHNQVGYSFPSLGMHPGDVVMVYLTSDSNVLDTSLYQE